MAHIAYIYGSYRIHICFISHTYMFALLYFALLCFALLYFTLLCIASLLRLAQDNTEAVPGGGSERTLYCIALHLPMVSDVLD